MDNFIHIQSKKFPVLPGEEDELVAIFKKDNEIEVVGVYDDMPI